jgi:hypothetical protein
LVLHFLDLLVFLSPDFGPNFGTAALDDTDEDDAAERIFSRAAAPSGTNAGDFEDNTFSCNPAESSSWARFFFFSVAFSAAAHALPPKSTYSLNTTNVP